MNHNGPTLELMKINERAEEIKSRLFEIKNSEPLKKESLLVGMLVNELQVLRKRLNEIQTILLKDVDENKISLTEFKINRVRLLLTELYIDIDTEIRLASYAKREKKVAEYLTQQKQPPKIEKTTEEITPVKAKKTTEEIE